MGGNFRKRNQRRQGKISRELGIAQMSGSGFDCVSSHARLRLIQRLRQGESIPSRRQIKAMAKQQDPVGGSKGNRAVVQLTAKARVVINKKTVKMITFLS